MNIIKPTHIQIEKEYVALSVDKPVKVVSSAMHNAGVGMYSHLVNRSVAYDYDCMDAHSDLANFLEEKGFPTKQSVAMMTAVFTHHAVVRAYDYEGTSIVVVITAGLGNAVDITRAFHREDKMHAGTINTWVIVNGELSDEAFFQAMISATEAKSKALFNENIIDSTTGTIATGTSTDSLLIAATQSGPFHQYAGPITPLGTLVGYAVYETMRIAIAGYKAYKEENPS